jgi:two-component system OmpR family sensor kinase/two-component system sensor histidine kinase BaeS
LRSRFIIAFALIIAVSLTAVYFFAQQAATNEVRSFLGRGGWLGAEELVSDLESYYAQNGSWAGAEILMSARGRGQGAGAGKGSNASTSNAQAGLRLADANGTILVSNTPEEIGQKATADDLENATILQNRQLTVGYLLAESDSSFQSSQFEENFLAKIKQATLQAALLAGVIGLILALVLTALLLRPIRELTKAASQLAEGNYAHRVTVTEPKELASLGQAFNQMANSIEQAGENRKAMTEDIAHELRTPLAVQRAQLEAMQDHVYSLSEENLNGVLKQNLLLSRMVDDLRILAMADAGALNLIKERINLLELVQDMVARFQAQAAEKGISILFTSQAQQAEIEADSERIQQIINNLMQNGLRYTPEHGTISITLKNDANTITLEVHDSGEGIPEEALPYIFDRFYRADKARDREKGGYGLGLAIAQQLAQSHAGRLTAENHPQGGALFRLRLPLID